MNNNIKEVTAHYYQCLKPAEALGRRETGMWTQGANITSPSFFKWGKHPVFGIVPDESFINQKNLQPFT